jgi:hypothetical protein
MRLWSGLLLSVTSGVLTACGGASEQATVTQTVTTEAAPSTPAPEDAGAPSGAGESSGKVRVPNVVGKDHQLAQDTMQAAGLYNLSEEDATGQGRALIYDRNWTVVEQDPPSGTLVTSDQTITATVEEGRE